MSQIAFLRTQTLITYYIYSFPIASVTNAHKLSGLKQQKYII